MNVYCSVLFSPTKELVCMHDSALGVNFLFVCDLIFFLIFRYNYCGIIIMVLTINTIHCCYCLKKNLLHKLFYSEAMYYFIVSSSFSLATTDSSNLISKAVVVWSLIENALTLQGWNAKQFSSTSLFNYEPTYKIHNHFYYFPTALYRCRLGLPQY